MKVDCEGSEFPILLTSRLLARVERIVGEYHEIPQEQMELLPEGTRVDGVDSYSIETLAARLRAAGFHVSVRPVSSRRGIFDAVREG